MGFVSFDKYQAINNLARYSTGAAVNREEEPSGIVSGTLFMGGVSGATWAWKNRKDLKGGWKALAKDAAARDKMIKATKAVPDGARFSKIRNLSAGAGKYVQAQELKATANATGKATTATVAKTAGKASKITKFIKGNALFAAISLGVATFTDIIPAFKMGTDKGFKQIGKSTVKTAAEVGGWAAGTAIGAKAGAAVGTCIGGPVGTIVGGLIGAACGFAGSWFASKIADKAVGPSEVEIAQNEAAEQVAQDAKNNAETQEQVIGQSLQNLVANYAQTGELSEDDKTAKESLEKVLGEELNLDELAQQYKATEQAQEQAQATAPQDTTAPSAEQQSLQMQAQQEAEAQRQSQLAALQQTTAQQSSSTDETEEAEEPQGKKDKGKAKSTQLFSTQMTAYSSPLNNPFMTSSSNFSMANPYGTMSAMSNPYGNTFDSTTQSAQATDPNKFAYNPKA